jgi:hypothetical protein
MDYKRDSNGKIRDFTGEEIDLILKQREEQRKFVLACADRSDSVSMYTMGMCSDVQEMLQRGMVKEAICCLDSIKILIDERLSKKDVQGRHI